MISKFGTIELSALVQKRFENKKKYELKDYIDFVKGNIPALGWKNEITALYTNAGFFRTIKTFLINTMTSI
jgi:hypothetical protein